MKREIRLEGWLGSGSMGPGMPGQEEERALELSLNGGAKVSKLAV